MSFRSLYRKRGIISFCCLIVITLVAMYHKITLLVLTLDDSRPENARQALQLSWNPKEPANRDQMVTDTRLFQRDPHPFIANSWKIKKIHFYLNNTEENSIFPAFNIGRYIMVNPLLCRNVDEVDVVVIVHTAPIHFEKRQRIRQTFAKRSLFLPFEVRVAFLMGKPRTETELHVLFAEHSRHNDTIIGDFLDDYHNLTLKGVMGYRWISQYCSNARFILKIDDDVIVDMFKVLTRYIPHMEGKRKSIFCNVWRKNMKIERKGKWKVPMNLFSNTTVFPFYYCSGFTLLLSRDLISPLYEAAKSTPLFWIDDLFLFGILPYVVGGVTFHDYQIGKNISLSQEKTYKCWTDLGSECSLLSTLVRDDDFWKFWKKIQQLNDHSSWGALTFYEP